MRRAWKARLSSTRKLPMRLNCWNTRRFRAAPVGQLRFAHLVETLLPHADAAAVDTIETGHQVQSVLFPLPDSPINARLLRSARCRSTPARTASGPALRSDVAFIETPCTCNMPEMLAPQWTAIG